MLFYSTASSRNELEGVVALCDTKLSLRERYFFVILVQKYVEDVKQEEKDVPDLLEPIMRPTGIVKGELRRI